MGEFFLVLLLWLYFVVVGTIEIATWTRTVKINDFDFVCAILTRSVWLSVSHALLHSLTLPIFIVLYLYSWVVICPFFTFFWLCVSIGEAVDELGTYINKAQSFAIFGPFMRTYSNWYGKLLACATFENSMFEWKKERSEQGRQTLSHSIFMIIMSIIILTVYYYTICHFICIAFFFRPLLVSILLLSPLWCCYCCCFFCFSLSQIAVWWRFNGWY